MIQKYQFQSPLFRNLGYLIWGVLLIFSVLFYQERSIFIDSAFQLFELINTATFSIAQSRFSNVLTQILPVIAVKIGLPLKWVMMAYSINFILLFAFIYYLMVEVFKNDLLGWCQLLFFILLVHDGFYYVTPELYQGISLLLLCFAILLRFPAMDNLKVIAIVAILAVTIIFAHKLTAVFVLLLWLFFGLQEEQLRHWKYVGLLVGFGVLAVLHGQFFTGWYDVVKQEDFWRYLNEYYPNYWDMPANAKFLYKMGKYYYFLPIGFISVVILYVVALFKKEWIVHPFLKLGLILSCAFCYLFMIHVSSPNTNFRFYSEVNYLPLSLLISLPLLFDFIPKIPKKYIYVVLGSFVVIAFLRLNVIFHNHQYFTNRLDWFDAQLAQCEQFNTNRLILNANDTDRKDYIMAWSSSHESMLLSALKGAKNTKTLLITNNTKHYMPHIKDKSAFLTWFKKTPVSELNKTYFDLEDGVYYVLNPL